MTHTDLDLPERALWEWLAAHGVPFDVPTAALIADSGTSTPGPGTGSVCRLPDTRIAVHQLHDLGIDAARLWGPPAPPTSFTTRLYDGADGHATFEAGVTDLARRLGPPDPVSDPGLVSTNVRTARWTFGLASVSLTFWPPDLNRDLGSTFAYPDPLRWKASRLTILPAVMDDVSPAEAEALAGSERVGSARVPKPGPYANAAYWRRRSPGVADGVAVSPDRMILFVISERVLVIPRAAITSLSLFNLTPARGGGGASVSLDLAGGGGFSLLDADTPFTLDDEAERLRDLLDVPLSASVHPDI